MSRFYGDFDPAATASTLTETIQSDGSIAGVAQNIFPLSSDLSNTGAGDGSLSSVDALTFSSAVGTPYGPGSALRINDTSPRTRVKVSSSAAAVEMIEFSSAFTFEFWLHRDTDQNSGGKMFIDGRPNGQHSQLTFRIYFLDGKLTHDKGSQSGGTQPVVQTATTAATGVWQHYALARESDDTLRMFYDGAVVLTTSFAFTYDNLATGGTPILFTDPNVTNNFKAYVRDLRIIKDACLYTTAFTVPNEPLTATNDGLILTTGVDIRTHSHVWNYTDVYDARFADTWPKNDPLASLVTTTGATAVEPGNGFRYLIFTTSGSLTVPSDAAGVSVEYLVVGGGGGGTANRGAGAGAGGLRTNVSGNPLAGSAMTLPAATYPVVVGAGGTSTTGAFPFDLATRTSGAASSFNSIESAGGGRGAAGSGGSGAGGHTTPAPASQNAGAGNVPPVTPPQGNNGGVGGAYNSGRGGGGGGAGSAGTPGGPGGGGPGAGGNGHPIPAFASPLIAPGIPSDAATAIGPTGLFAGGGGGGGSSNGSVPGGAAGPGGGGAGGSADVNPGSPNPSSGEDGPAGAPGVDNTGGGGGGGGNYAGTNPKMRPGGAGGKGIVILKFPATEK